MKDFKPIVFIMRAREIQKSLDSIANFPYPKVWVEYYREKEIEEEVWEEVFAQIVAKRYTHISIFSDDGVMEPEQATEVIELAKERPVTCGWCNVDSGDLSNISKSPLAVSPPKVATLRPLLYTIRGGENHSERLIKTWFTGFSLHTMSTELWGRFPFQCYPGISGKGAASDFHLCWRLQQAKIPIVALKSARIYHIRRHIGKQDFKVLAGVRDKNIRWEE